MKHPQKLIALDVLRGLACLLVWVSHIRVATGYFKDPRFDFIQTFTAWGREAVVVFFILSGIVINLSSQNKTSRLEYFKKRFIRIYPIYLAVFAICFLSDHYILGHPVEPRALIGNFFLLSSMPGYIAPVMPLNMAVWSIGCEAFFYLVLGLIYRHQRLKGIWIWFAICGLSIIYKITYTGYQTGPIAQIAYLLNNSFLWILGYLLFEYRDKLNSFLPVAICGIFMVPMISRLHKLPDNIGELMFLLAGVYLTPFFVFLLKNFRTNPSPSKFVIRHIYLLPFYLISVGLLWHYSASLTSNKILYSFLPLLSLGIYVKQINTTIGWTYLKIKTTFISLAKISYPLYLLHMPVMYLIFHFIPGYKFSGMLLAIIVTLSVSYIFEKYLFERLVKHPDNLLKKKSTIEKSVF